MRSITNSSNSRDAFRVRLAELEAAFEALNPELELRVCDCKLGMEGYVVVWNALPKDEPTIDPMGKGGTRITPNLNLEEVRMLARIMALKNAAAGLPLGGAKSGLRADPQAAGFEQVYRSFVRAVSPVLVENGGTFGGFGYDLGAHPDHARWACDELNSLRCFTGKPVHMGGTDYDREGIAGLGVAMAARTAVVHFGKGHFGKGHFEKGLENTTFAVQGLGAMGAAVFRYFRETGAHARYVADPRLGGTFRLPENVDETLAKALEQQDFVCARSCLQNLDLKPIAIDEVLYQEVDVLFPCAVQHVITEANVDRIQARYVVEGANNPCSPAAQRQLHDRGIHHIPDFIANPGGIIAAYVELTSDVDPQENVQTRAKVKQAKELTRKKIAENVLTTLRLSEERGVQVCEAARYLALRNVFQ